MHLFLTKIVLSPRFPRSWDMDGDKDRSLLAGLRTIVNSSLTTFMVLSEAVSLSDMERMSIFFVVRTSVCIGWGI